MANQEFGISISQNGVPVKTAADYQKVLDSRWKFLEVFSENTYTVNLNALAATAPGVVNAIDTFVATHGLDDFPAYEAKMVVTGLGQYDSGYPEVIADKSSIYLRQIQTPNAIPAVTVVLTVRVYNIAIMQDYKAPREITLLESGPESEYGFRSLDGSVPNLGPADQSSVGYSIDTKKKILSVHQTGELQLNMYTFRRIRVTAIDTTTDTFTLIDDTATLLKPGGDGTDWIQTGTGFRYDPSNFTTYPAPLVFNATYYIIKVSDTQFKLATTAANAQAGIAIDITSAGSLPGYGAQQFVAGMDTLKHDVGYPPTFMLAKINDETVKTMIGPLQDTILARVQATNSTIKFGGIQSLYAGRFGLIILKDPAEIAS